MSNESVPEGDVDPAIVARYEQGRAMFLAGDVDGFLKILRELAAEGVAQAQHALGDMYLYGYGGGEPDPAAALECYLAAVASDYPPAFNSLGTLYYYGIGVERSVHTAAKYYGQGMKRSDLDSLVMCAQLCASGELREPDHQLAITTFWEAARSGSPLAQWRLGDYYSQGKHVEQDLKLAAELYEAAAQQGDEQAILRLGQTYAFGNSAVPRDLEQAIRWFRVAAEKGSVIAQHNLAVCYTDPDTKQRDMRLAAMWFHRAAEGGYQESMKSLSLVYTRGDGVDVDLKKAAYWRERATAADLDPVSGLAAAPPQSGTEPEGDVSREPSAAGPPPADGNRFTEAEERQLVDMSNRIRAVMRELGGNGHLQALVVTSLLAELLAPHDDELREAVLEYVVGEAQDRIPINERLLKRVQ
jgi:TPR repeat protein